MFVRYHYNENRESVHRVQIIMKSILDKIRTKAVLYRVVYLFVIYEKIFTKKTSNIQHKFDFTLFFFTMPYYRDTTTNIIRSRKSFLGNSLINTEREKEKFLILHGELACIAIYNTIVRLRSDVSENVPCSIVFSGQTVFISFGIEWQGREGLLRVETYRYII